MADREHVPAGPDLPPRLRLLLPSRGGKGVVADARAQPILGCAGGGFFQLKTLELAYHRD